LVFTSARSQSDLRVADTRAGKIRIGLHLPHLQDPNNGEIRDVGPAR
jgi:hypothetical protein